MYKQSFLVLVCLTATALAQDDASVRPALGTVSATTSEPTGAIADEGKDLERYLLKLKSQRKALAAEQEAAKKQFPESMSWGGAETAKLRAHLGQLMTKLGAVPEAKKDNRPATPIPPPPLPPLDSDKKIEPILPKQVTDLPHGKNAPKDGSEMAPATDALALGHVLYKAGNWELALKAYRMVSTTGMKADERAPIQYMTAACLRKMGKLDEAAAVFREVANIRGDEQIAACAQWELVQLRSQMEFETQLKDVRERRKALEASK